MSTTPDVPAVARWMAERVERDGYLDQAEAVHLIDERFGEDFTYQNDSGGWSIDKRVLKAFRELTADTAVWESGEKAWRRRTDGHAPGRRQE